MQNTEEWVYVVCKNERLVKCFRGERNAAEFLRQLGDKYISRGYVVRVLQTNICLFEKDGVPVRISYERVLLEGEDK